MRYMEEDSYPCSPAWLNQETVCQLNASPSLPPSLSRSHYNFLPFPLGLVSSSAYESIVLLVLTRQQIFSHYEIVLYITA